MSAGNAGPQPPVAELVEEELERGGAGRPEEIARRLGPDWTEDDVRAALAALFCDGVVGHSHDIGLWWVA